ncbi:hypothetical protein [Nonomuraea sp. NPDC048826]|uniref:hypothetical protein n=1 Tax=Nonomuraea sp. NPDC048826 TaxID=3364347 RepID=UPI0037173C34
MTGGFAEIGQQGLQPPGHGGVSFNLRSPAAFAGVMDELLFDLQAGPGPHLLDIGVGLHQLLSGDVFIRGSSSNPSK